MADIKTVLETTIDAKAAELAALKAKDALRSWVERERKVLADLRAAAPALVTDNETKADLQLDVIAGAMAEISDKGLLDV